MPRLSSGKIDRKKLKESPFFRQEIGERATTEADAILFDPVTRLFPGQTIWRNADFFTDLDGNCSAVCFHATAAGYTLYLF
jgi:hypothetical protein